MSGPQVGLNLSNAAHRRASIGDDRVELATAQRLEPITRVLVTSGLPGRDLREQWFQFVLFG